MLQKMYDEIFRAPKMKAFPLEEQWRQSRFALRPWVLTAWSCALATSCVTPNPSGGSAFEINTLLPWEDKWANVPFVVLAAIVAVTTARGTTMYGLRELCLNMAFALWAFHGVACQPRGTPLATQQSPSVSAASVR